MTPKETAKELVDKFYDTTPNEAFIDEPLVLSTPYSSWGQAKQCALIAVDEIVNALPILRPTEHSVNYLEKYSEIQTALDNLGYYWQEVKQEIELL